MKDFLDSGVTAYLLITLTGLILFSALILVAPGVALAPPVPMTLYRIPFFLLIIAASLLEKRFGRRGGQKQ